MREDRSDQGTLDALQAEFQSSTGRDRQLAAEALGLVAALVSTPGINVPETLATEIKEASDRDRRLVAEAVGRLVAYDTEARTRGELVADVRQIDGLNRWRSTRLLGEIVAIQGSDDEAIPATIVARVRETRADKQYWAPRVVGEAATLSGTDDRVLKTAVTARVRETSGLDRRLTAQTLGEVVCARASETEIIPIALSTAVRNQRGQERWLAAWAIGLIVASGSTQSAMAMVLQAIQEGSLEADELSALIRLLATTGEVTLRQFREALSTCQHSPTHDAASLWAILDIEVAGRRDVLAPVAVVVSRSELSPDAGQLSQEIRSHLAEQTQTPNESRLAAIHVLVHIEG